MDMGKMGRGSLTGGGGSSFLTAASTTEPKAQESLWKKRQKGCKSPRIRKSAVRLYL